MRLGKLLVNDLKTSPDLMDFTFFSDKANFHLSGHTIKQNMCFWAQDQSHEHQYHPLSVKKVIVWCVLHRTDIIGTYWFEDADGCLVTVNIEQYI